MSQADDIAARLKAEVAKAGKALILEIDANLRRATPVDTGHARASWIPSVGSPSAAEASGSGGAEHAAGIAAVLKFRLEDGVLYESNNAPYIQQLNLGHSRQAAVGWIETAVDQAEATIQARYQGLQIDVSTGGADHYGGAAASNLASAYAPEGLP